jgi:hypothetical protein
MLRQKLHFTEQFTRKHGIHVNNISDADRMKECIDLLDSLMNDDYHEIAFTDHLKRFGQPQMIWEDIEGEKDLVELKIEYPKVKTPGDKAFQKAIFRQACKTEALLREADLDQLFKLMRNHIQEWWD